MMVDKWAADLRDLWTTLVEPSQVKAYNNDFKEWFPHSGLQKGEKFGYHYAANMRNKPMFMDWQDKVGLF